MASIQADWLAEKDTAADRGGADVFYFGQKMGGVWVYPAGTASPLLYSDGATSCVIVYVAGRLPDGDTAVCFAHLDSPDDVPDFHSLCVQVFPSAVPVDVIAVGGMDTPALHHNYGPRLTRALEAAFTATDASEDPEGCALRVAALHTHLAHPPGSTVMQLSCSPAPTATPHPRPSPLVHTSARPVPFDKGACLAGLPCLAHVLADRLFLYPASPVRDPAALAALRTSAAKFADALRGLGGAGWLARRCLQAQQLGCMDADTLLNYSTTPDNEPVAFFENVRVAGAAARVLVRYLKRCEREWVDESSSLAEDIWSTCVREEGGGQG